MPKANLNSIRTLILLSLFSCGGAMAQTATYHLHREVSSTPGQFQLNPAGPDTSSASFLSGPMAVPGDYLIAAFDTQAGVPNAYGYIPAGSAVAFSLWMQATNGSGTVYPEAKVYVNNLSGPLVCAGKASSPLTTNLQPFNFTCATVADVATQTTDRLYLWVGAAQASGAVPSLKANLSIEGALNGNYDSQITLPVSVVPAIGSLSAPSGQVETPLTISGSNFGPPQNGNTVTFGGVAATIVSWSDTSISVLVPPGSSTGNVVVTVAGVSSNGSNFVNTWPSIGSLSPNSGPAGTTLAINGANFGAAQGASTITFNGTAVTVCSACWSDKSIAVTVPATLPAGNASVAVTVNGTASNPVNFGVSPQIFTVYPPLGPVGMGVVITGLKFGAAQGTSTVTLNGVPMRVVPNGWSDIQIVAQVPSGAFAGYIVVTVAGQESNEFLFTVSPPYGCGF